MNFQQFINWERASRDTIDFKRTYVDISGDLVAGLMLSEIMFWYLPDADGNTKLRVEHEDHLWIAVPRWEWWDRCRITPKQADRCVDHLKTKGLIDAKRFKFNGQVTVHIRVIEDKLLTEFERVTSVRVENPFRPKGKMEITQRSKSISTKGGNALTETTSKTTNRKKKESSPTPSEGKKTEGESGNGESGGGLTEWQELCGAVSDAWQNTDFSYVGLLAKFLTGKIDKDGDYKTWQLSVPMTPSEIRGFRRWVDKRGYTVMPSSPESIFRNVSEFRGGRDYDTIMLEQKVSDKFKAVQAKAASQEPEDDGEIAMTPAEMKARAERLSQTFGKG